MPSSDSSSIVSRESTTKDGVERLNPIILSESSRTKVVLWGWYIHHSDHIEFSAKIQTLRKSQNDWFELEDKTITLSSEATLKLAYELPKLVCAAQEGSPGDYLIVKLTEDNADLDRLNPDEVIASLFNVLNRKPIIEHLNGKELGSELARALQYSVRLSEMKAAMLELRELLDSGEALEKHYQSWCEKHPWAFGNQFVVSDEIRSIGIHDQVDMLVPRILAGFRDIIELKRPDMEILAYDAAHRDYYFTRDASMAIGQCHRYLDKFVEAARHGLDDASHIVAYHPEATIVMGRMKGWDQEKNKALHGLNSRLSGVRLITYDHLLAQGDNLVEYLSKDGCESD